MTAAVSQVRSTADLIASLGQGHKPHCKSCFIVTHHAPGREAQSPVNPKK
jgi:hypothetical protein